MRNFVIGSDDRKYEVIEMFNVHGHETQIADEAEAVIVQWSKTDVRSHPVEGKVWTLQ